MRKFGVTMIGLAMIGLAACDRGQSASSLASDTALSRDLNLANQAQPFQRLDSVSALETAPTAEEPIPMAAPPAPVRPPPASSATPARRTAANAPRRKR